MHAPDCHSFAAPIELRSAGVKGLGLFCTRDILAGEIVVIESPMLLMRAGDVTAASAKGAVNSLPSHDRRVFDSLSNAHRGRLQPVHGILLTNAIVIRPHPRQPDDDEIGVFALASRFNASCTPTVTFEAAAGSSTLTFRAIVDLVAGEELTIVPAYPDFEPAAPRSVRQAAIERHCRYRCACDACVADEPTVGDSDARRLELGTLLRAITRNWGALSTFATSLTSRCPRSRHGHDEDGSSDRAQLAAHATDPSILRALRRGAARRPGLCVSQHRFRN